MVKQPFTDIIGSTFKVTVIVGNRFDIQSSNPKQVCLHLTSCLYL